MEERRQKILQELEEKGKVRVTDLSKSLHCSEVTIRSDIKAMQEEGLPVAVITELRSEADHSGDMGVHPPPAYLVSARLGEPRTAETGKQRADNHYRPPESGAFADKFLAFHIFQVYIVRLECIFPFFVPCHFDPHPLKEKD